MLHAPWSANSSLKSTQNVANSHLQNVTLGLSLYEARQEKSLTRHRYIKLIILFTGFLRTSLPCKISKIAKLILLSQVGCQ